MRRLAMVLFGVLVSVSALAGEPAQLTRSWPLTNGTAVLGGNAFTPRTLTVIGHVAYLDDYQIIPRVLANSAQHATVDAVSERTHELQQLVFTHPEWTINQKLGIFMAATDVVDTAWANPTTNCLWVKFSGHLTASEIDLNQSTPTDLDMAFNNRVENIRLLLQLGGRYYLGDDYEILMPRQQLAVNDARLQTMSSAKHPVYEGEFKKLAPILRDRRSPVPLNLYRTRR